MGLKDTVTDKEANQITAEHHDGQAVTSPMTDEKDIRA